MSGFPESPRVIYAHNPLEEVICQLRFPPVLRIDAEVPAAFQEAIRAQFPGLREARTTDIAMNLPPDVAEAIGQSLAARASYDFVSNDEQSHVSLTRDFIALTTKNYVRWEGFKEHLLLAAKALEDVYAPAAYTRVGLRYRDVVCRSRLGLDDATWPELLSAPVLGELGDPDVGDLTVESKTEALVRLPHVGSVRMRHGLATSEPQHETCYLIDSDFFSDERTELNHAVTVLDEFNRQAGRLFRWAIRDRLHEALGPVNVQAGSTGV